MNIALLNHSENAASETFIRAHKELLDGNIFYYYGQSFFFNISGEGSIFPQSRISRWLAALSGFFYNLTWFEYLLYRSLKRKKIGLLFAEYGTSGVKVLRVAKKLKLPLIVHFHGYDAYVKKILEENAQPYKYMFEYAAKVVAVSGHMKQQLISLGCPAEKIALNPYGPGDDFFKITPRFTGQQFIALGRFVDKKAPYYLVLSFASVLKKYPAASLIIGGQGPLLDVCKNMVKAMKLEKSILFPGKLSPLEFAGYLESSNAFVQHSVTAPDGDREGTPVAVLEAMAAGIPVVSTKHTGISDAVVDEETGYLVEEHDMEGMTEKMILIFDNTENTANMGKNGKARIVSQYKMQRHIEVLNQLIRQYYHG